MIQGINDIAKLYGFDPGQMIEGVNVTPKDGTILQPGLPAYTFTVDVSEDALKQLQSATYKPPRVLTLSAKGYKSFRQHMKNKALVKRLYLLQTATI